MLVDVQVDFTGLASIRPHRSLSDRRRECTLKVSGALTQSRSELGAEHPYYRHKTAAVFFGEALHVPFFGFQVQLRLCHRLLGINRSER